VALAVLSPPVEGGTRLSYSPAEAGASVTAVRLYETPARTGVPVFQGVPTLHGGVWTFSADLEDGDYYSAFDVTDSTGAFIDDDDFFYVLSGEVVPGSQVVSMAEVRVHVGAEDDSQDSILLRHLGMAIETVSERVGAPLLPQTRTEPFDRAATIILPSSHVRSATVTDSGGNAVPYVLRPGGLLRGSAGYGQVTVTYTEGFDRLPDTIRQVVLDLVRVLYDTRIGALPPGVDVAEEVDLPRPFPFDFEPVLNRLGPYRRGPHSA
jgi:hypothetical protein